MTYPLRLPGSFFFYRRQIASAYDSYASAPLLFPGDAFGFSGIIEFHSRAELLCLSNLHGFLLFLIFEALLCVLVSVKSAPLGTTETKPISNTGGHRQLIVLALVEAVRSRPTNQWRLL